MLTAICGTIVGVLGVLLAYWIVGKLLRHRINRAWSGRTISRAEAFSVLRRDGGWIVDVTRSSVFPAGLIFLPGTRVADHQLFEALNRSGLLIDGCSRGDVFKNGLEGKFIEFGGDPLDVV